MPSNTHQILIIDDERDICRLVEEILCDSGYSVKKALSPSEALPCIQKQMPHLILLDVWFSNRQEHGLVFLGELRAKFPTLPVIMMSGHSTLDMAVQAIKKGACDFIEKPFEAERLLLSVERALEMTALRQQNFSLKQALPFAEFVNAKSNKRQSIQKLLANVAPAKSRVLIKGPAGSGKGAIAHEIHRRSTRAQGPFTILNCAMLDSDGFEEKFFGVEAGQSHPGSEGLLEQSHNGTLLLKEITYLSSKSQQKILRVLQSDTFQRVGGKEWVKADVRILSSTRFDLTPMTENGDFCQELFYRLNVISLDLPSLEATPEDIPFFSQHFIKMFSDSFPRKALMLNPEAMSVLEGYKWPGNLRELRNVIERLYITTSEETITPDLLPLDVRQAQVLPFTPANNPDFLKYGIREARAHFEKHYLQAQIKRFGGNITETARIIGMERSALHRKMRGLFGDIPLDKEKGSG